MNTSRRKKAKMIFYLSLIARDRTVLVFFMTAFSVVAIAAMRPQTLVRKGMRPSAFRAMKAEWRHCANVVAGGDSRAIAAICPQEMRKVLGDLEILNYGFRGTGFSDTYCQWLEKILIPDAQRRVIILCVTPSTLTEGACRVNGFTDYVLNSTQSKQKHTVMDEWLSPFAPFSIRDIRDIVCGRKLYSGYSEGFPNGWQSVVTSRPELDVGLRQYRKQFAPEQQGPASPLVVKELSSHVRQWKEKGIEVYGFRPPTCREMEEIENEKAQFNEAAFAEEFESAGGVWFGFDRDSFHTADGSHLLKESSIRLSRELAEKIVSVGGKDK